ncbi:angiopoietin-related protein 7-like isoform X3 [Physella acuta]|uniref:angiopoietin-related protein 7-like isoform X3 n=1 Tax=Physella acuta TaxID=109671 RepID=UPI0027DD361E|nr:angiopoietin-related protein 7-like isoform X3 [Physella acuta]
MSALYFIAVLAVNLFLSFGLKVDMTREHFYHGKSLFCAQLQCTENITEDTQMSALVNMSVYRISESEGKILLASISGSDSKVRDYKISGILSEGKLSKHHGELVLSFSNTSACNLHQYKCQVYFTNKTGDTGMLENRTTSYEREKIKKSVLLMNLKAQTLNYVKSVDTMADFLKSFEDPEKLKGADVSMSLQMSHSGRDGYSDDTAQIPSSTELNNSNKHISSTNAIDVVDAKINNITEHMQTVNDRFGAIDVKLNEAISGNNQINSMIEALNTTVQEMKNDYNVNPVLSRISLQCKKNDKTDVPERTTVRLGQDKLALCDTKTDGGGWIIIQRRVFGDVNFTRGWNAYKHGFGSMIGDFWLGNDWISNLTFMGYNELRIDMTQKGKEYYAHYDHFKVDNEAESYTINVTSFSGNVKDYLNPHIGMRFSTIDRDNDRYSGDCAGLCKGGWWYNSCRTSALNGVWGTTDLTTGIVWSELSSDGDIADSVEMKVRQV